MPYEPITDEAIAEVKKAVGLKIPLRPYVDAGATRDAIMRVAYGNGEDNPLYIDEEYAAKSKYGRLLAPPYFLWACMHGAYYPELPEYGIPDEFPDVGVRPASGFPRNPHWYIGDEWEWSQPVLMGDVIDAVGGLYDVSEVPNYQGRGEEWRTLEMVWEIVFTNQRQERVGRLLYKHWKKFHSIKEETTNRLFSQPKPYYSEEELKRIGDAYDNEQVRGAEPRYWEDVQVGDELPGIVKGPHTLLDLMVWLAGSGRPVMTAHKMRHQWYGRAAKEFSFEFKNEFGAPEIMAAVEWDNDVAQAMGLPRPCALGPQRTGYLCHLITNWMGDDGFIERMHTELRAPELLGDVTWCKGVVAGKRQEEGRDLVDLDLWCENQDEVVPTRATAVVRLPSKSR